MSSRLTPEEKMNRGIENNRISKRIQFKADLLANGMKENEIEVALEEAFPTPEVDTSASQDTETQSDNTDETSTNEETTSENTEEITPVTPIENEQKIQSNVSEKELSLIRREIELEEKAKYLDLLNAQLTLTHNEKTKKEQEVIEQLALKEINDQQNLTNEKRIASRKQDISDALEAMESLDKEKAVELLMKSLTLDSNSGNSNIDFDKEVSKRVEAQFQQLEQKRVDKQFKDVQTKFLEENKDLIGNEDFVDVFNAKFEKERLKGASNFEAVFQKAKEQTLKVMPQLVKTTDIQSNTINKDNKPSAKLSKELEDEAKKKNQAANIAVSGRQVAQGSGSPSSSGTDNYMEYSMKLKLDNAARLRGLK